jgi:hypothetical protein
MPLKTTRCRMNPPWLQYCVGESINVVRGPSWFYQAGLKIFSDGTAETVAEDEEEKWEERGIL